MGNLKNFVLKEKQSIVFLIENEAQNKAVSSALESLSEDLTGVLDISVKKSGSVTFIFKISQAIGREQYSLKFADDAITFIGGDTLGLMWGIYDFCENVLGVNPFRKFLDLSYKKKTEVNILEVEISKTPRFKYRGWFFNDEDYLTGWRTPSGKRNVDYLFYSNIMNHETVDELIEAILRCRLNLMIPSSFTDIEKSADEENIKRITDRGLYVSQHHIEPLGVSRFTFEDYFRRKGLDAQPSYYAAPDDYDEVWRYYVKKWAKYKNVIWQVGLRGKVDRPVWLDDPNIESSEEFGGKLISKAVAHQLSIIKEVTGNENPIVTMTLWEEGAELYRKGYLTVPDGVIIVFTNWPRTQLMRPDFRQIERNPHHKYGAYHHVGSFCAGPHAVQGQKLDAMRKLFDTIDQKGDNEFLISNVQNLREVVFGANVMSKLAFSDKISEEQIAKNWCRSILPEKADELYSLYKEFYDTFPVNRWDDYTLEGTTFWFDGFVRLAGLYAIDNYMKNIWDEGFSPERSVAYPKEMKDSFSRWCITCKKIEEFMCDLEDDAKIFVKDNLYVQANIMRILSEWAYLVNHAIESDRNGEHKSASDEITKAIAVLNEVFSFLSAAEHGKFEGWYNLEDKFDYKLMIKTSQDLLNLINTPVGKRKYWENSREIGCYILNYKYVL